MQQRSGRKRRAPGEDDGSDGDGAAGGGSVDLDGVPRRAKRARRGDAADAGAAAMSAPAASRGFASAPLEADDGESLGVSGGGGHGGWPSVDADVVSPDGRHRRRRSLRALAPPAIYSPGQAQLWEMAGKQLPVSGRGRGRSRGYGGYTRRSSAAADDDSDGEDEDDGSDGDGAAGAGSGYMRRRAPHEVVGGSESGRAGGGRARAASAASKDRSGEDWFSNRVQQLMHGGVGRDDARAIAGIEIADGSAGIAGRTRDRRMATRAPATSGGSESEEPHPVMRRRSTRVAARDGEHAPAAASAALHDNLSGDDGGGDASGGSDDDDASAASDGVASAGKGVRPVWEWVPEGAVLPPEAWSLFAGMPDNDDGDRSPEALAKILQSLGCKMTPAESVREYVGAVAGRAEGVDGDIEMVVGIASAASASAATSASAAASAEPAISLALPTATSRWGRHRDGWYGLLPDGTEPTPMPPWLNWAPPPPDVLRAARERGLRVYDLVVPLDGRVRETNTLCMAKDEAPPVMDLEVEGIKGCCVEWMYPLPPDELPWVYRSLDEAGERANVVEEFAPFLASLHCPNEIFNLTAAESDEAVETLRALHETAHVPVAIVPVYAFHRPPNVYEAVLTGIACSFLEWIQRTMPEGTSLSRTFRVILGCRAGGTPNRRLEVHPWQYEPSLRLASGAHWQFLRQLVRWAALRHGYGKLSGALWDAATYWHALPRWQLSKYGRHSMAPGEQLADDAARSVRMAVTRAWFEQELPPPRCETLQEFSEVLQGLSGLALCALRDAWFDAHAEAGTYHEPTEQLVLSDVANVAPPCGILLSCVPPLPHQLWGAPGDRVTPRIIIKDAENLLPHCSRVIRELLLISNWTLESAVVTFIAPNERCLGLSREGSIFFNSRATFVHFNMRSPAQAAALLLSERPPSAHDGSYRHFIAMLQRSLQWIIGGYMGHWRYAAGHLWPLFCRLGYFVDASTGVPAVDPVQASRGILPYMAYMRAHVWFRDYDETRVAAVLPESAGSGSAIRPKHSTTDPALLELAINTRYLLVAAYIASFNPSETDRKYLSRDRTGRRREARRLASGGSAALALASNGSKSRISALSQLQDAQKPTPFDFHRWIRVFFALLAGNAAEGEAYASTVVIDSVLMGEIRMLAKLGAVVPVNTPRTRYACLLPLLDAVEIARTLDIELHPYLHDPASDRGAGGVGGSATAGGSGVGY